MEKGAYRMVQKNLKNLDRLPLELQADTFLAELPALRVEFEGKGRDPSTPQELRRAPFLLRSG